MAAVFDRPTGMTKSFELDFRHTSRDPNLGRRFRPEAHNA
jgi:hypothetical protein